MSVSVTTDIHCDTCGQWLHFSVGPLSQVTPAKIAARRAGWTAAAALRECKCPKCNGTRPGYWQSGEHPHGRKCGDTLSP